MAKEVLISPKLPATRGIFSHGTRHGNIIYVSGQVAFDSQGSIVGTGDIKAQTRQVLENIKAVLDQAGATMDDIVKVTVFITDMDQFSDIHEVRAQYFTGSYPASTMVEVRALAYPELLIEMEAVAITGQGTC